MSKAISAYRYLWRSSALAFQGDLPTLIAARNQIRDGFRVPANQQLSGEEIDEKIKYAYDVATILRRNVVQAAPKDGSKERYETELGDNDSIKKRVKVNTLTGNK